MQFLKRFLEKQKEIFKKYFENTPIYLAVKNLVIPIILGVGGWCSRSFQNPYILIYVLLFVILIFAISMYYMSSHYVNMKELYFDKDVFLIDMLTHIEEVKH